MGFSIPQLRAWLIVTQNLLSTKGLENQSVSCFIILNSKQLIIYLHLGRLKGKVVFITGASSGIGEHTAIALARNGVRLVLAARRRDELERVKGACIGKLFLQNHSK